ncbi:GNAT family N-acetyltransferase [Actinomadura barringtoniae]|uniref:GNAT family N-acetyltransferase n=1 Tax=Actinomadura barringtoniae TaxID=1427535 RepID=A0A939PER3_9ACTN|nr:GNAT family N-acetyltransferase [Actinomadura barringtoniae]MBO2451220.1 GNAT family N-acetyltransferase [Actinomadura barringtoniae]
MREDERLVGVRERLRSASAPAPGLASAPAFGSVPGLASAPVSGSAFALTPIVAGEGAPFPYWEIALMVENAFGGTLDPGRLTESDYEYWRGRLGHAWLPPTQGQPWADRYWITTDQGRVGTVSVGRHITGRRCLSVSSLYIHPAFRRNGLAWGGLDAIYQAALAEGLDGFQLHTDWVWRDTVRYYLARGMWVCGWKFNIGFARQRQLPRYQICLEGEGSAFLIEDQGEMRPLLVATRSGDRLCLEETLLSKELEASDSGRAMLLDGRATFALRLALDGWPLVRSLEAWNESSRDSGHGQPEGLAYRIPILERRAREFGWNVESSEIPGLGELPDPVAGHASGGALRAEPR